MPKSHKDLRAPRPANSKMLFNIREMINDEGAKTQDRKVWLGLLRNHFEAKWGCHDLDKVVSMFDYVLSFVEAVIL